MKILDFRSDTLTLPTQAMLSAMLQAELGDDGRVQDSKGEDPTVNKLEDLAARLFGKEDALFVPSGTMGNMVSLLSHDKRGASIVVDKNSHVYRMEKSNFEPGLLGYHPEFVPAVHGCYDLDVLNSILKTKAISLVCIENSHNFSGGTVLSPDGTKAVVSLCRAYGVPVHLDGARIFHAAAGLGVDVVELVEGVDSVMFCLSKGLGAPVGSVVVGTTEFIKTARRKRKLLGGQMRQVGVLAAAGIVALEKMTKRVHDDNLKAKQLAQSLDNVDPLEINMGLVQSNIVRVKINASITAQEFAHKLYQSKKIKVNPIDKQVFRMVLYYNISNQDVAEAASRIREFCAGVK